MQNRFPGYLTLIRPMPKQSTAPAANIARPKRFERAAGAPRSDFGVASRDAVLDQLDTVGELAPNAPLSFIVVRLIALDELNREYGEEHGDIALRTAANTLAKITRATDMVGRISGTSFGVVLQGTGSIGASAVAARIAHHLDKALDDFPYVRVEVGIATGTGVNANTLPMVALDSFPEIEPPFAN